MTARRSGATDLELFLFGGARVDLSAARRALQEMQGNRCFYCGSAMRCPLNTDDFTFGATEGLVSENRALTPVLTGRVFHLPRFFSSSPSAASGRCFAAGFAFSPPPPALASSTRACSFSWQ